MRLASLCLRREAQSNYTMNPTRFSEAFIIDHLRERVIVGVRR